MAGDGGRRLGNGDERYLCSIVEFFFREGVSLEAKGANEQRTSNVLTDLTHCCVTEGWGCRGVRFFSCPIFIFWLEVAVGLGGTREVSLELRLQISHVFVDFVH